MIRARSARETGIALLAMVALLGTGCGEVENGSPADAASGPAARPSGEAARGPRITFVSDRHDFGAVWTTETHECSFAFTNTGDEMLVIRHIKPTCRCTAATLDKREYAPGEGAAITVTFKPGGHGHQDNTLAVVTNDGRQNVHDLTISADVRRFMTFEPQSLFVRGIRLGAGATSTVDIFSADPEVEIVSITVSAFAGGPLGYGTPGDYISARLIETSDDATPPAPGSHHTHRMEITLGEDAPWGVSYGVITVTARGRVTPDAEEVEHSDRVQYAVATYGDLQASDTLFRVSLIPPGSSFVRPIRFARQSGRPFALEAFIADTTMPGVSIETRALTDGNLVGYELILRGDTTGYTGMISGTVEITTDVPGEEYLTLVFIGMVNAGSAPAG